MIAETLSQRGMVQMALNNHHLAIQDINSALDIAKQYSDKMSISKKYNALATIFSGMNEYNHAMKYYLKSDKFKTEFTQEKFGLLQQQNNTQQASIIQEKTQQKYLWGIIVLSLFVFVFTYSAYVNQRNIKRKFYKLSTTDHLTQIANRRHIIHNLKAMHDQAKTNHLSFALIMIDLDYFKKINDLYGHDIGNEVLVHFAKVAQGIFKGIGEVGRIGGEEWLILVPNTGVSNIEKKLTQLRSSYKNPLQNSIPEKCKLSFSSGIIIYSGQYQTHENMLRTVDHAMYQAKAKGRDQDIYM